jgi:hypothetical protein
MTISEDDVIQAVNDFTAFSCGESDSNILYDSSTRTQGNFSAFYLYAIDILDADLLKYGKQATDAQKIRAYAYLIADLQEKKDPDVLAKSVSFDGYSVSRDGMTGSMKAYCAFLDALPLADSGAITALQDSDGLIRVNDHDAYPESWRLTGLASDTIDPF